MTKTQLKTGMILELRNGNQFLLLRDMPTVRKGQVMIQGTDIAVSIKGNEGQIDLMNYSNHLYCYDSARDFDIVKVSVPKFPREIFNNSNLALVQLWERNQKGDDNYEKGNCNHHSSCCDA